MNVGFLGGWSTIELATPAEMLGFFDALERVAVPAAPEEEWSLITDRLYRRYIPVERTDDARALMHKAGIIFSNEPFEADNVDGTDRDFTALDLSAETLGEAYRGYFDAFDNLCEAIEMQIADNWDEIRPIRVVITDTPEIHIEERRPLHIYDDMDGPPLWLVPVSEREDGTEEDES